MKGIVKVNAQYVRKKPADISYVTSLWYVTIAVINLEKIVHFVIPYLKKYMVLANIATKIFFKNAVMFIVKQNNFVDAATKRNPFFFPQKITMDEAREFIQKCNGYIDYFCRMKVATNVTNEQINLNNYLENNARDRNSTIKILKEWIDLCSDNKKI